MNASNCKKNKIGTAEVWQDLAHFKRLRTSHIIKPKLQLRVQLAVYRYRHYATMCKQLNDRSQGGSLHTAPIAFLNVCCCITGNMLSLNAEHTKATTPLKLHSQHPYCGQKFQTANNSGLCVTTEKWHAIPPLCCKWTTLDTRALGKKCSLHYPQEQQTCTSHMREVEVSVAIFLEKVGFTDKVHGQCRQNLAERARTAWR